MAHPSDERPTNVRYIVLAALATGAILSYLLRVSLSPAGTTVQRELEISDAVMGDVFAAFFLGYFWFQIPGGWIGNRFGTRLSLGVMGLLWAAATAVSASAHSTAVLQWSRVALGVTQAGLFPVMIMAIRDWFPSDRRGLASSVITACMSLGAVLASALSTRLLVRFGWRETFWIYGLLAAGWGLGFLVWFRDSPDRHPAVNRTELDLIQDTPPDACGGRADLRPRPDTLLSSGAAMLGMIRSPGMWALCGQAFFQAFAYAIFITWFPAYLEKGRGLSLTRAGDMTILPLVTIGVGSPVGGYLIDLILKRTGNRWLSRCALPAAGLAICGLATAAAALVSDPLQAVAVIALGMLFAGIAMPGKWACTIDLTAACPALGFALMNMSGNVGAWACPKVVGRMFHGLGEGLGSWDSFLYLIALVELAGAVACLAVNPNKPAVAPGS